jgi:hypothetical protein
VIGLIGFRQEDYMKRDVTKFVMKMWLWLSLPSIWSRVRPLYCQEGNFCLCFQGSNTSRSRTSLPWECQETGDVWCWLASSKRLGRCWYHVGCLCLWFTCV